MTLTGHFHDHFGLGDHLAVTVSVVDGDREGRSREEVPVPAQGASYQEFKGTVRRFELVSAVLHLLNPFQHRICRVLVDLQDPKRLPDV